MRPKSMTSVQLPPQFQGVDEDEDDGRDGADDPVFQGRSLYGMIAQAGEIGSFAQRWQQETDSDSEGGGDGGERRSQEMSPQTGKSSSLEEKGPTQPAEASDSRKHRKGLSETRLLRSFLKPIRERSDSQTQDPMTHSQFLPPREEPIDVPERPSSAEIRSDAPMMDRKLQAQAKAELEASALSSSSRRNKDGAGDGSNRVKAPKTLSSALAEIFSFDEPEEVILEYPCWYQQSVLLQGFMYITQKHVCFYAYLQKKAGTILKSGHLSKRGKQNPHYNRYWFILKGNVLSYYANAAKPYHPSGIIDLRYGISAEVAPEKGKDKSSHLFTVTTDERTYQFKADSAPSAMEWVKQLQKVIFRSHNDGDSVKISLPLQNVVDVEENPVIGSADTVKLRVIDNDETYAIDEYFFTFFTNGKDALSVLTIMTQDNKARLGMGEDDEDDPAPLSAKKKASLHGSARASVEQSRSPRLSHSPAPLVHENVRSTLSPLSAGASSSRRTSGELPRSSMDRGRASMDRGRSSFDKGSRSTSAASRLSRSQPRRVSKSPLLPSAKESTESFATSSVNQPSSPSGEQGEMDMSASQMLSGDGAFRAPTIRMPQPKRPVSGSTIERMRNESQEEPQPPTQPGWSRGRVQQPPRTPTDQVLQSRSKSRTQKGRDDVGRAAKHSLTDPYKPQPSAASTAARPTRPTASTLQTATALASFVHSQGKRMSSYLGGGSREYYDKFSGAIVGGKRHYSEIDALAPEERIEDPETELEVAEHERRFRQHFALPETEKLIMTFYASLHRVLPLYGKIYISARWFCFRSLLYGTRTKIVIPFRDIDNVEKEKGFRFGYPGMVLVLRGHEELFFDFRNQGLRDECTVSVLRNIDFIQSQDRSSLMTEEEKLDAEAAAAENDLLQEVRKDSNAQEHTIPDDPAFDDRPVLFDDPSASVLDFKPKKSLRIVCLTIGSRGDVQPYIALCKGLLADGHRPKIATHAEFGPWVIKHGIDFAPVEGNPAELMRLCVEHGMFTPKFIYETNYKFRGWLDELLHSAWEACSDSELLIESPSAMAGIHIAEALGVPYFRAFTMMWTRTRAYPHAFAAMNSKMGGTYNLTTYGLFENIFWQMTAQQINRWRRKTLDIGPTSSAKLQQNKVPFLYNFSPSFIVPPLDFSDWVRVTGYWFLDEGLDWTPPDDLLAFIKKARDDRVKLVYIGFGSIVVSDSKAMTQSIVDAVLKADVRCILSKGWSDRLDAKNAGESEVALPPSILKIGSAPHDWLFRQVDAAVHHGGAGTTGASLRAGIPTIIKPFFGDQFFSAARVEDVGVGIRLRHVSPLALGKALWIATHDDRMRTKARVLGERVRAEDGVRTAVEAIYRDLEYAKTLIQRKGTVRGGGGGVKGGQGDGNEEGEEEEDEAEESWTFVEADSDLETVGGGGGGVSGGGVGGGDPVGWDVQARHRSFGQGRYSLGSLALRNRPG